MKDYQKPELEIIALVAEEKITFDGVVGGDIGVESAGDLFG